MRQLTKEEKELIENKIEWEGLHYYLLSYTNANEFMGTVLEKPIRQFQDAYDRLCNVLISQGIHLEM